MNDESKPFASARTAKLLSEDLNAFERGAVEKIEEFGFYVLSVAADHCELGWSYTFGCFDTLGIPELVVIGLPPKTAYSALNEAVALALKGIDLTHDRHREVVGEVEVIFRSVDPEWAKELMNSAKWFNAGWDFPVLQLIYPDLENRFQWEPGFTEYFRQPLLEPDAPKTLVEVSFMDSLTADSKSSEWKFKDSRHTTAYLSNSVASGEEAVVFVSHDADGDWQFLGESMSDGGGPVVVCLHHPIDKDPSLMELADLPFGWCAERDRPDSLWVRRPLPASTV